jgi:hypothetical protein
MSEESIVGDLRRGRSHTHARTLARWSLLSGGQALWEGEGFQYGEGGL